MLITVKIIKNTTSPTITTQVIGIPRAGYKRLNLTPIRHNPPIPKVINTTDKMRIVYTNALFGQESFSITFGDVETAIIEFMYFFVEGEIFFSDPVLANFEYPLSHLKVMLSFLDGVLSSFRLFFAFLTIFIETFL